MKNMFYQSHHDKSKNLSALYRENGDVERHFHRSYELLYILKGKLEVTIMNKTFVASKDDIVFVNKYYSHEYRELESYKKYILIIPSKMCDDFANMLQDKTLPGYLSDKKFNKNLLPLIQGLKEKNSNITELIKKGYINIIIGELLNHYKLVSIKKNTDIETIIKILDYSGV